MDHGAFRELAAGAALDDLDATERRAFGAHLPGCRECSLLSRNLADVLGELSLAAPTRVPPVALRGSVVGSVTSEQTVTPLMVRGSAATTRSRSVGRWRLGAVGALAMAAVLAVVAVGLGIEAVQLNGEVAASQARLAEQAAVMSLIVDPAHRTASLTAEPVAPVTSAVVVYRPGTADAFVMADRLPATPAGMVYQLWVADETGVHPLGTFEHDGRGPFLASFGVDLGTSAAAMITLEPTGGAVGEPGPQVVFGEL